MHELTERFVTAFAGIEQRLRKAVEADSHVTFYQLVKQASQKSASVRRLRSTLEDFADLRNVLLHKLADEEIAVPSRQAVERLEGIGHKLAEPPKLTSLFPSPVLTCRPTDRIGAAAKLMREKWFSQLPVRNGSRIVGLLTTDTISRWLAACLDDGIGMLDEQPVEIVLKHQEKQRNHELKGREATAFDALEAFDEAFRSGESLDSIIVTQSGQRTEVPIGIVTVADFPVLVRAIDV